MRPQPFPAVRSTVRSFRNTAQTASLPCGTDGYTGDKVCKDCGFVIEKGEAIPALGAGNGTGSGDQLAQTNDPAMMAVMAVGGVTIVAAIAAAVAFAMRRRSQH